MDNDYDLLMAWRSGDAKAGETLYEHHVDRVYRFFRTKLNDLKDVEDLVQESFLVLINGAEFRGDSQLSTFLYGIARNKLLAYFKQQKRNQRLGERLEEHSANQLTQQGPVTLMRGKREQRLLLEALRKLPLDRQILMELYFWEEFTSDEVGAILEINPNTVRSRISRTKEQLAKDVATMTESDLASTLSSLRDWAKRISEEARRGPYEGDG